MPTRDSKKAKEQARERMRRMRAGRNKLGPEGVTKAEDVTPETTADGRPIRTIHWTDADGQARVTRYCDPLPGWKGMGWCRDCNQAVVSGSNHCGCKVLA